METLSDEALVREVKAGNVAAFEDLVRRYQGKLHSFVTYVVRDHDSAWDVVQESFISLYKTIDRIDSSKKFSSYLFSITRNHAISYLRNRTPHASLNEIASLPSSELPESLVEQNEEGKKIEKAIDTIDIKYKKVISLYYFEDLSYEEIGKCLHLPVNTIRTHLRRAKKALRRVLIDI